MVARIHFAGPIQYRVRSAAEIGESILKVSARRMLKGPRQPSWSWLVELNTEVLKRHVTTAFTMRDVGEARSYLDSVVISSPALSGVDIRPIVQEKFRGSWFTQKNAEAAVTVLYFHGGGYSFYPRAYANFIALTTLAAKSRTFAVDYRLSPEHRFPAQLEDALNAYRWLLETGTDPDSLIFAGDSAGGNLALTSLLAARDSKLPLPALAIALSPATDIEGKHASIVGDPASDWIDKHMIEQWADWFCDSSQRRQPLVSPLWADLRGLPPIYIQAGRSEILYDSIQAFAARARSQGAEVVLETWKDMNHDFQIFGPDVPQSAEALDRIGEVIAFRVRREETTGAVSTAGR
jgi:monoterpene epsilon-lactone hydrolase